MARNITYKCPTCGGDLAWNANTKSFKCKYCEDEFTNEQLEALGENHIDEEKAEKHRELEGDKSQYRSTDGTENSDLVAYTCSHCGAEIITNRTTAATICVFCQNPVVMSEQVIGDFSPKYVIPFKVDKSKVMDAFKRFAKKPLTPKNFNPDQIVEKMQGVYVPFWLYSAAASGTITGEASNQRSFTRGGTKYKEISYYNFSRSGSIKLDQIPVDASKKIEDDAMDSIEPYDYRDITEFSPAYLAGFLAERYDLTADECYERADLRIKNTLKEELRKTANYSSVNIRTFNSNINVESTEYALLPAWILYTKYEGENYLFAMNGQTGKFIGNLPIDKFKLTVYTALGAIGGFFVGMLGSFLFF